MREILDSIMYANFLPVMALSVFIFFVVSNAVFNKRQTTLFLVATLTALFMILNVSLDALMSVSGAPYAYMVRRVTSVFNFAASPVMPVMLYLIFAPRKPRLWFYVPLGLNVVICAISAFAPLVFRISERNTYGRGPLFLVPFAVGVFYLLLLMLLPDNRRQAAGKRMERLFLLVVIAVLGVCMALEVLGGYRFLIWSYTAPALVLYYLLLNIQSSVLDVLTGVYNRRMYEKALVLQASRGQCEIAMLDINNFKYINDHFGHEAGDVQLIRFAEVLSRGFSGGGTVYRVGGDEFAVIWKKASQAGFQEALDRTRALAREQKLEFACGVAVYEPGMAMKDVTGAADQRMYENKRMEKQPVEE